MPSRKKSYRKRGSRKVSVSKANGAKGDKAGKISKRGSRKRSLRFTPKFVIKERADAIEDTLNLTRRRDTHRIPGDIANIIQGYEGGDYLYYAVDPKLDRFTYSSTTSFKNGEKIIVDYEGIYEHTFIHFLKAQMPFRISNKFGYKFKDLYLVVRTDTDSDITEDDELLTYVIRKHYEPFIENMRDKYDNEATIYSEPNNVSIEVDRIFSVPSYEYINPIVGPHEIVFEKSIPTEFGL